MRVSSLGGGWRPCRNPHWVKGDWKNTGELSHSDPIMYNRGNHFEYLWITYNAGHTLESGFLKRRIRGSGLHPRNISSIEMSTGVSIGGWFWYLVGATMVVLFILVGLGVIK